MNEPTLRELYAWMKKQPGTSWVATINDIESALGAIVVEQLRTVESPGDQLAEVTRDFVNVHRNSTKPFKMWADQFERALEGGHAIVTLGRMQEPDAAAETKTKIEREVRASSLRERAESKRSGIWLQIMHEREKQDAEWGGPDHDDEHTPLDWTSYIEKHAGKALSQHFRQQMIRVAALAVAAIESYDRKSGRSRVGAGDHDSSVGS